jgi:hypothetical protein
MTEGSGPAAPVAPDVPDRRRTVRDRDVVIRLGIIVAVVLGVMLVAGVVRDVGALIERMPLVVLVLVVGTVLVLLRTLRR